MLTISAKGQLSYQEMQQQVLTNDRVDSLFVFGKCTKDGSDETSLKYLGKVVTIDGQVLKIMNSCWVWGLSQRATSRILVFDGKNQYLGNYYTLYTDLPDRLQNGKLVFTNKDKEDCELNLKSEIDLSQGIPKEIFIKCKGEEGNLYVFSTE